MADDDPMEGVGESHNSSTPTHQAALHHIHNLPPPPPPPSSQQQQQQQQPAPLATRANRSKYVLAHSPISAQRQEIDPDPRDDTDVFSGYELTATASLGQPKVSSSSSVAVAGVAGAGASSGVTVASGSSRGTTTATRAENPTVSLSDQLKSTTKKYSSSSPIVIIDEVPSKTVQMAKRTSLENPANNHEPFTIVMTVPKRAPTGSDSTSSTTTSGRVVGDAKKTEETSTSSNMSTALLTPIELESPSLSASSSTSTLNHGNGSNDDEFQIKWDTMVDSKTGKLRSDTAVASLFNLMRTVEEDAQKRQAIMTALTKTTSAKFIASMVDPQVLSLLRLWLVKAVKEKRYDFAVEILKYLRKLPMTIEALRSNTLAKTVKTLTKMNLNHDEIVSMSGEITESWLKLVQEPVAQESTSSTDSQVALSVSSLKAEKRSREEPSSSGKSSPSAAMSSEPVRKAKRISPPVTPVAPSTSTTKAAPKRAAVSEASSKAADDIFSTVFKQLEAPKLKKQKKHVPERVLQANKSYSDENLSSAKSIMSPMDATPRVQAISKKTGKPKKRVSWVPDGLLCSVRLFDSDEKQTATHGTRRWLTSIATHLPAVTPREFDKNEARTARKRLSEEMKVGGVWYIPKVLDLPEDVLKNLNHEMSSSEKTTQVPKGLNASYYNDADIPPSAKEPDHMRDTIGDDADAKEIILSIFEEKPVVTPVNLSDTLKQLLNNTSTPMAGMAPVDPNIISSLLNQINIPVTPSPASLVNLPIGQAMPHGQSSHHHQQYAAPRPPAGIPRNLNFPTNFAAQYHPLQAQASMQPQQQYPTSTHSQRPPSHHHGQGGQMPCRFFRLGKCAYGDTCKFRH